MITKQHEVIITDLKNLTLNRSLTWSGTSTENEFETYVGDYKIIVYKIPEDGAF